jgi:rare lipoprotein A
MTNKLILPLLMGMITLLPYKTYAIEKTPQYSQEKKSAVKHNRHKVKIIARVRNEHSTPVKYTKTVLKKPKITKSLYKVSWYGRKFHGKKTASGRKFNMNAMTAAHKTLPLLSYAKVTNPKTNKSVIVQITDRGPFVSGREMDLSFGAANRIGVVKTGVANVIIQAYTK